MNVMIVICHPRQESLNHAAAERARQSLIGLGYHTTWHDLYREGFDPVLREEELRSRFSFDESVQRYWQELEQSEGLVIVHPDWWGQPPALLKGWVDRVFRPGIAYEYEGDEFAVKHRCGLLAGKKGLVLCTTDAEAGSGPSPLSELWLERLFAYCGIRERAFHVLHNARGNNGSERTTWLDEAQAHVRRLWKPLPSAPKGT